MAFTLYKKPLQNYERYAGPRVAMRRDKQNGTGVILNKVVADHLKWIAGDRVEILIGSGTDEGRIALRRSTTGYKLVKDDSSLRISSRGLFPGHKMSITNCAFAIEGQSLVVTVPAAFTEKPVTFSSMRETFNATVAA